MITDKVCCNNFFLTHFPLSSHKTRKNLNQFCVEILKNFFYAPSTIIAREKNPTMSKFLWFSKQWHLDFWKRTNDVYLYLPHPTGTSKNLPIPSGTSKDLPEPSGTSKNLPNPSGTSKDLPEPSGNKQKIYPSPLGQAKIYPTPLEQAKIYPTPFGTSKNLPNPSGTSKNLPNLPGTSKYKQTYWILSLFSFSFHHFFGPFLMQNLKKMNLQNKKKVKYTRFVQKVSNLFIIPKKKEGSKGKHGALNPPQSTPLKKFMPLS